MPLLPAWMTRSAQAVEVDLVELIEIELVATIEGTAGGGALVGHGTEPEIGTGFAPSGILSPPETEEVVVASHLEIQEGGVVEGGGDGIGVVAVHEVTPGMRTGEINDISVRSGKIARVDRTLPQWPRDGSN